MITTRAEISITTSKIEVDLYQKDLDFRNLHDQISEMFAEFLTSDLRFMESGEIEKISLASKFCPSIDSNDDRATLLCENIAKKFFPRNDYDEYKDVEEAHYAYKVGDRLRKPVLVPLCKALESSPMKMNATIVGENKTWSQRSKALIALESYQNIFKNEIKNETKLNFESCMKIMDFFGVSIGDGIKLPHQVIASMNKEKGSDELAELQWQRLVQQLSSKGKLRNCLAVCDIPESRRGTSNEMVCVAMGLLISELSENPWKGMVFPFGDSPNLHKIEGDHLWSKCEFMRQMECAEKLDFLEIYRRVLDIAVPVKLSHNKMPRRIFVFTNRDFGEAFKYDWCFA